MNLHELHVRRFGGLVDRRVGPFRPGLNVLFGPNEAGKTTVFRFLRGTLHGWADARRRGLLRDDSTPGTAEVVFENGSVQFARTVDGDGRLRSEPSSPPPAAICESLTFFHPYESNTVRTLVAAAENHGIDLRAQPRDEAELDRLDGIVGARRERVVRDLRSLFDEHRRLGDRLAETERRDRARRDESTAHRTALDTERETLRRTLAESRRELERAQQELRSLEAEYRANARARCERTTEQTRLAEQRLRELTELDERIERARRVVGDLDVRASELQADVERGTGLGAGDASRAVRELEAEVERLAGAGRCRHCGGGHETTCCDTVRSSSETLRERVYRVCDLVGRREAEARATAAREELREVEDCRRGLRTQLSSLSVQRVELAESLSNSGVLELLTRTPAAAEFCTCERHRPFLASLRERLEGPDAAVDAVEKDPPADDRTVVEHRRRIERLTTGIERDERRLAEHESERAAEPRTVDTETSRCNAEIAVLRSRFAARAAEFREVERQRSILADLRATAGESGGSPVADEASRYLHRVTAGHCTELRVDESGRVEVRTASRGWTDHDALGAGTQHVVGLVLRLAIADEMHRRGTPVPLVLDDVLVDNDLGRQRAAVELLAEAADRGQQIVLLTCHLHLREACRSRGGHVVDFAGTPPTDPGDDPHGTRRRSFSSSSTSSERPRPPVKPRPSQPTPAARAELGATSERVERTARSSSATVRVEQVDDPARTASRTSTARTTTTPLHLHSGEATASVRSDSEASSETFGIDLDDDVRRLPGTTRKQSRLLGLAGVRTVGDLLDLDVDASSALLTGHGIDAAAITRWRSQALLLVTIPGLRGVDAAALVELELLDADAILALTDDEFETRLGRLRESSVGRGLLQSGRRFDRDWWNRIRSRSRRARSWNDARSGSRSGRSRRGRRTGSSRSRNTAHRQRSTARGTPRPNRGEPRRRDRTERTSRSNVSTIPLRAAAEPKPSESKPDDTEPRFYLERSSPVVDAPSIGPKTAGRFEKIGVHTVDDLLNVDPDEAASKIAKRHISADVIRQWQAQASLVCRVPEIRGHDAQILVACGIDEPEALSAAEPKALLADVLPFCRSSAGKRIIRSGKAPDLAEVTAWISWSQKSRSLRAA